jgi:hypothetical protein
MSPPKAVLELQKRLVCNHECLIKCPPLDCKLTILFTTPPRNKPPGTTAVDTEDFFEWLVLPPAHDYYCTPRACELLPPLYRAVMEEAGTGVRPDIVLWIDGPRVYIPPSLIKPKPRGRNDGPHSHI